MKKIVTLAAVALFALNASAQKKTTQKKQEPKKEAAQPKKQASAQPEVVFNVEYKAATTYIQKMDMDMDIGVMQLAEGEEEGVPFNQEMNMAIIYTVKTGVAKNGDIPFTAQMDIDSPLVPGAGDQLKDTQFYGRFIKGTPTVDSVTVAGKNNAAVAEELQDAFAKALNQFPTTPVKLKVGESFKTSNLPVDLPGLSMGDGVNTSITYTLKKIEGDNAYFDLFLDTPLDIETRGIAMKGNMKMTGIMTYNTKEHYVLGQDIDMDSSFKMNQQGVDMKMSILGKNKVTTTLTPN